MGLDMYLTKRTYVKNWDHHSADKKYKVTVKQGGKVLKDIKPERVTYIIEEIGYWRKANHIHKWFVDNCQDGVDDCRDAYVSSEDLKKLYDICKEVMDSVKLVDDKIVNGYTFKDGKEIPNLTEGKRIKHPAVAKKLLPTSSGFFFGSEDYDQWYVEDIEQTIKILESTFSDEHGEYYYNASW